MKAISIKQPYASLIVAGLKTIECRSWATKYRGPIVICASQKWAPGDYEIPKDTLWAYPTGCAVGTVDIIGCVPFADQHLEQAGINQAPSPPGYAWQLANAKEIEPVPVKGKQGFFEIEIQIN